MKRKMNKSKAMIIALMAAFTTAYSSQAHAMNNIADPPAKIKYLGNLDNNPVFQLNLNNADSGRFVVIIRDEYGTILHAEKITGKNISRTYRIDTDEEIKDGGLRFEVKSAGTKKTEIFEVSNKTFVTTDVAVHKVQ